MNHTLLLPDSLTWRMDEVALTSFFHFLQEMVNLRTIGSLRYERHGKPTRGKNYLTRLELELDAYRRTGNSQHLRNLAVYAFLEDFAPENARYFFSQHAKSVTRRKLGGSFERGKI